MSSSRRRPLFAVLACALIVVGVLSSLTHSSNRSALPGGLSVADTAESTALYCTGLSGDVGPQESHVAFLNTTDLARTVLVQVVNDLGQRASDTLQIAPHATTPVSPIAPLKGHSYAVEAQVSGGGVVAQEITRNEMAE